LIEFNEQFPVHALAFGEENSGYTVSLMCEDFSASVDQGALKIKHRVYGDLYWHSDRTLELYSKAKGTFRHQKWLFLVLQKC
jgi:hypothetical protein